MAGTAAPTEKKIQVNVRDSRFDPPSCSGQYKHNRNSRERSRSILPPSPEGSRSAASATAAAASARALASSAFSCRTSAVTLRSAGVACAACACCCGFRLPVAFPSDLRVLLLWVLSNPVSSSPSGREKEFRDLRECCDVVETGRDEASADSMRLRFRGRWSRSTSVSPTSWWMMRQP